MTGIQIVLLILGIGILVVAVWAIATRKYD